MPETIKKYFEAFSQKNLTTLSELYDDAVVLWEWGEKIYLGKKEVLEANEELFNSFTNVNILTKSHSQSQDGKHFNEIIVLLDGKSISVIDVIVVENDKIVSIAAYRGF